MADINLTHTGAELDEAIAVALSGGGAAPNSIVITELDANKRIIAVDVSSFTEIYPYMFMNASSTLGAYIQTAEVILPSTPTTIGIFAFHFCANLVITSLPNSITTIGQDAFRGCAYLAITSLPNNLTLIDTNAFSGCTSLRKIWIPAACTTINATSAAAAPFYSCHTDLIIYCEAASRPSGWPNYWSYRTGSAKFTVNWGVTKEAYDAL